ncbi:MAG: zinc-binding dehydrogenase [Victivallales bacterium]|nr:zinc-binding dehydrogenase [Victivallales bacterium]
MLAGLEERLWDSLSSGKTKVLIHKTLPMSNAEAAHAILQNNENLGKVVLTVE